jgi:hypothetical protein
MKLEGILINKHEQQYIRTKKPLAIEMPKGKNVEKTFRVLLLLKYILYYSHSTNIVP